MNLSRRLVAVLAVLCLFGAQQAAFAHWAAHLGAAATAGLESTEGEHAAAAVLGQSCTSCATFAGLESALPGSTLGAAAADAIPEVPLTAPQEKSVPAIRRYDCRAPPAIL